MHKFQQSASSIQCKLTDIGSLHGVQAEFYSLPSLADQIQSRLVEMEGTAGMAGGQSLGSMQGRQGSGWQAVVVTGDTDAPSEAAPRLLQVDLGLCNDFLNDLTSTTSDCQAWCC